jgi:hypothetical protein
MRQHNSNEKRKEHCIDLGLDIGPIQDGVEIYFEAVIRISLTQAAFALRHGRELICSSPRPVMVSNVM